MSVSEEKKAIHPRALVSLSVKGSFTAVMRTVGMLENSSYDTLVTGVTLGTDVEQEGAWEATTVLSVALERQATTTPKKP